MANRRDAGLGWGDRDWGDGDFEGRGRPRGPSYGRVPRNPEQDRPREQGAGRGPDLPYGAFYGRDYFVQNPEFDRYNADDFGAGRDFDRAEYDRDFNRRYTEWRRQWEGEGAQRQFAGEEPGYAPRVQRRGPSSLRDRPRASTGRRDFTGVGPRGYTRSDERIRDDVNERLAYDPDLDASDIEVRVQEGTVTLTGIVEDRSAKRLAEDLAEDVLGVHDVANELKVRHGLMAKLTGEHMDDREVAREKSTEGKARTRDEHKGR